MEIDIIYRNFDVIIIGAGGAGLSAALSLNEENIKNIAVINKSSPNLSHTISAKGGINAAFGNVDADNYQYHIYDTIKSGDYICDYDSVELLCKNATNAILNLEKIGVNFTKFANGQIYQRKYGGQTLNFGEGELSHRACCVADKTGYEIHTKIYEECLRNDIQFFNDFLAIDLLIEDHKCFGSITLDLSTGKINIFQAKSVIIASGGYNQIYQNNTSVINFSGDLIANIIENNLAVQDMEFIQFHPTSLTKSNILISEAVRAEGGILLNAKGERFMAKYAPKYLELASRDVVARAIATEIYIGNGAGENKDHLWLDISHINPKIIEEKLIDTIDSAKLFANINVFQDKIPIIPAAHYTMGGIPTNVNCQIIDFVDGQEITIDNLFAIGEVACNSVHGANRLGCNSLLDIIVFGNLTGKFIAQNIQNWPNNQINSDLISKRIQKLSNIFGHNHQNINLNDIRDDIKNINQKYVGIFRNEQLLSLALKELLLLQKKLENFKISDKNLSFNQEFILYFEVKNLLIISIMTCFAAINRKESRGAHFREDYQDRNDQNFMCHSLVKKSCNSKLLFSKRKIRDYFINENIDIKIEKRQY